ncbi:hypothetical protein F5984_06140 [Rudanella paleaurantiibacter]|uniref:T9SS type A sorting domain-containing protein n=1 Tax=Rudanella paleaurantiibacter TaxID=2614655 RepID=A0A7J5U1Y4_9BACT|nr:hypothetical protein [Rudanella paleaurantiibacter]KAB7731803.1 hypothetical protein F5984_06140 [Rudanella paleaurantiibacter]
MKTVIKSILLGLSLFVAFCALLFVSASAVEARPIKRDNNAITTVRHAAFAVSAGRVLNVNVEKPAGEALRVEFTNSEGRVMAEQFVSKQAGAYSMKFNIEQLPDGVYQVRIMGKEKVGEYSFTLKSPEQQPTRQLSIQ